ncbi:phage portal protein, partial [Flavitalea sp.]|nr:phage portal protein [Flavitalea sp.]
MANIIRQAARSVLRPLGFVDASQGSAVMQAQSSLNRLFRAVGLSLYSPSDWKMDEYIDKGYADNATLYSVVNRIMRSAALAPFKVYRVKDGQEAKHLKYKAFTGSGATAESLQQAARIKSLTYEEDTSHELNTLIEKPNKYQGGNEFTQLSIGYKLLTGNRLWFKNVLDAGADAGKPIAIYNLPPQCANILAGSVMYDIIAYEFQMVVNARIEPNLIIHSRYPNFTFDGSGSHLWGMAPMQSGRRTLDRSNKAERRAVTLL